jgi:serine/threonine-protein kinase HipA
MNNYNSTMARRARVFYNDILAGYLMEYKGRYAFLYDSTYVESRNPSIALDMPKKRRLFRSTYLFPYFQGLLPEGMNKSFYCERLGISRSDKFALLVNLANYETIGAVTVR